MLLPAVLLRVVRRAAAVARGRGRGPGAVQCRSKTSAERACLPRPY